MKHEYSKMKKVVDLGTGSGILPIVLKENAGFIGHTIGLDAQENALECAKINL